MNHGLAVEPLTVGDWVVVTPEGTYRRACRTDNPTEFFASADTVKAGEKFRILIPRDTFEVGI